MRLALLIALLVPVPVGVFAQSEPDPIVSFDAQDAEMNAAIASAQASLPLFLAHKVDDEGYGPEGGYLKVGFPVKDADINVENIWVGPFLSQGDEQFVGLLANEPQSMPGQHYGDQVSFTYDMIVDWNFDRGDGRFYGDYTTRVVVKYLPEDQSKSMAERFLDPPVPTDWQN